MQHGISFLPDSDGSQLSAGEYYQGVLALSEIADQNGLESVKMTEHYLHPYGGFCPHPVSFLSAVAARTKRIRLMTGCILPAFHHPIQIASETSALDSLSNGRLDVGFARAYLPYEFDALGVDIDESRTRYVDTIEAVIRCWSSREATVRSPFFSFSNAHVLPDVLQKPHPPVWCAAVMSRESFAWIGERGFNLLVSCAGTVGDLVERIAIYREARVGSSIESVSGSNVALSLPLLVRNSTDEARDLAEIYLARYIDVWASAADSWKMKTSAAYPGYSGMARGLREKSAESMISDCQALVGNPKEVIEKLRYLRDFLDVEYFLWQIDFGSQPFEVSARTLQLLIEDVIPVVDRG